MKQSLLNIWKRLYQHRYTSVIGIAVFVGYHLLSKGKISFDDFKDYIALIPTIVLLLAKDPTKKDDQ